MFFPEDSPGEKVIILAAFHKGDLEEGKKVIETTREEEFYPFMTYTDDVNLNKKSAEWVRFYNYDRPQGAFNEKTPYEALRNML